MNQVSFIPSHDGCFACGPLNEIGLRLIFEAGSKRISCRTTLDRRYQGYNGIVHGGVLASIADSVMANLVHNQYCGRPFTCNLRMRYRRSVHLGDEVVASAEILKSKYGIVWALCRITEGNRLCAEATVAFKIDDKRVSDG
jgi:uncharacterized protein (TIGR00369 family)